jgi:hypothetical protein
MMPTKRSIEYSTQQSINTRSRVEENELCVPCDGRPTTTDSSLHEEIQDTHRQDGPDPCQPHERQRPPASICGENGVRTNQRPTKDAPIRTIRIRVQQQHETDRAGEGER